MNRSWKFLLVFLGGMLLFLQGNRITAAAVNNAGMIALVRSALADSPDAAVTGAETAVRIFTRIPIRESEVTRLGKNYCTALAIAERDFDQAGSICTKFSQISEIMINLGKHAGDQSHPELAVFWTSRAAALEPALRDPWYFLSLSHQQAGNMEEAFRAVEKGIVLSEGRGVGRSDLLLQQGILLQSEGNSALEKVEKSYRQALRSDDYRIQGMKAETYYQLGELRRQQAAWKDAEDYYRQAVNLAPDHYLANLQLAETLYKQGGLDKAERAYLRTLELYPSRKWAYLGLGRIYRQRGQCQQAIDMYQRVLEIDPADQRARQALKELSSPNSSLEHCQ